MRVVGDRPSFSVQFYPSHIPSHEMEYEAAFRSRTTVCIAHRLSNIRQHQNHNDQFTILFCKLLQ